MNHIYRLVWSQVRRTWLVVSELARGRGKAGRTSTPSRARSVWWAALPLSLPMLALAAAPAGITAIDAARPAAAIVTARAALAPTVIAPVVSSAHPIGGQVTAGSGRIDYGDHLTTIQQHSQNLSLNWLSFNIGAQDTVNFLQPNAQAIAVNRIADPNGSVILGRLNANGQVFLINPNGVLFGKGAQVNVGGLVASTLDVSDSELGRGALHFGGTGRGSVTNLGTLTAAPGGYVALLGHTVSNQGAIHALAGSVALAGGSAVTLSFDGSRLLDMQIDASTLNALAENKQLIVADGGQVLMSAGAKDSLLASVVNNSGTIQARTVENRAGKIVLLGGMAAGTTRVDGTLDASAPDGGDGGFIETSAAQVQVADATKITTLAAAGNAGTWLIDPTDFTIAVSGGDMTGATLSSQLGSGNVTIQSTDGSAGTQGNINVNDTVSWNANTLTLNALNNINVNAAMNASGTAGLALAYGQANPAAGNTSTYNVNAPINLADAGSFSTTLGNDGAAIDYTIITGLGDPSNLGAADLLMMGNSGYYVLGADIDASATAGWSGGFAPVLGFTGTFDGLGHTITGLTINRPGQSQVGLFGLTQAGSIVRNVGMVGGAITGNGLVGNLVGDNHATISHVYATGTVTDVSAPNSLGAAGGLVGSNSGTITDAYATGAVTSGGYAVGGLVGFNLGTITNAYATGATSSGTSGASGGGLVGVSAGTITHGYWDTDTASQAATAGVTGLTTQQLIASLPAGFDPAIWGNGDNQTTPYMLGWAGNQVFTRNDLPDATGARLYTVVLGLDHLQAMQANLGGRYVLGNAIDASDTSGLNGGTGFVPLGTDGAGNVLNGGDGFTGTFDGLGYAISGLSIDRTNRVGLFGYAGNGSILRNVRLLGGAMTGNDYVGGLVGQEVGGTITSSYATNVVTGNDFVGGLVGSSSGTITDAYATGAVTGKIHVGGLVGENDGGTIDNAYATNVVTGSSIVGGLVGSSSNGTITDAYATGAVTGNESFHGGYVGGLVGQGDGDTITNVHATGVVIGYDNYVGGLIGGNTGTITNAYATGSVTGSVGNVGGLIGNNAGTITNTHATGTVKGYGYVGGLIGNNTGAITNAHAIGAATGYGSYVGGLIGGNTGAITSAYATGAATAGYYYVGGLIGSNTGAVASVYATGAATGGTDPTSSFAGATDYVGGLIGSNAGMVNNAYATGAATAVDDYVGGLMGSNDGVVTNVYATGAVTGKSQVGGLVGGNGRGGAIYFAYATGNVSGESQVGGLVGFNDGSTGGTVGNSYWDTTTTVQTEGCGGTSCGSGASGYTTTQMMQLAFFASWGANIDAQGGTGSVWRIYEGHTAPLLRSFLTPHTASAQPDFDGSGAALANIASSNITVPTDAQILGSVTGGDTLTLAGLTAGGGYTATSNADLSGLYSTQQGYDLIGDASRIISTPGSAAGEVRLDNGASWSSGTLAIATAGNINIMGALSGDALRLNSGGAITDTRALNVASFLLGGGNWQQLGATLPAFNATDFSLAGGSFVRALGGDGSSGNPWQLADLYGLQGAATLLSDSFTLSNNIDASATASWNAGAGFAPIGNSTTQFTGTFDGLGHTISDLTINRPAQDNVGLFGFIGNGTLRNIGLVGGSVNGADYVGGLAGQVSSGNISNAYATGTVSGNNYVGGLMGYFGSGNLGQSYATGNVSGVAVTSSYIGGLAGYLDGGGNYPSLLNVSDVYATGNVSAGVSGSNTAGSYIGGLVGFSSANISNAYATGTINLSGYGNYSYIGGLVGYNGRSLEHVHAAGNINISSSGQYVGGLVGSNGNIYGDARITYAYATGSISAGVGSSGGAIYVGGLVGQNSAYIENAYATGNLVADPDGGFMLAGGLVGRNGEGNTPGSISNVYATGNVDGGVLDMYLGGLVGQNLSIPRPSFISNAYSTGHVSGTLSGYSGGSVGDNKGILQSVYWNTETSGQSSAGAYTAGAIGLTSAQMMQAGSFGGFNGTPFYGSCIVCGSGISTTGGTGAAWRIYEGHTTPLLSVFLTPYTVNAQPDFDGSSVALANIASVTVPTDPKILGSVTGGNTLTLAGLTAGGGYTASSNADLSGLYSTQQGYDLIGSASRTISTPGSAAGEVRLDNGASWNSGTLAIATAGNINIAGALNGDALHLNGGGTITDTNALNVGSFVLGGGNWNQIGATLPTFSATDFTLAGGSFVRALGGDGSSATPYQLADVYGLQGVGTLLGDSFTLSNNIDASAATGWNAGAGFAPIGDSTTQFTGTFDGLGHTISDLTINRPTQDNVGLFGYTSTGSTISNVGLLSGSTTGRSEVGSLAGYNDGTINQAYATGAVSSSSYSGGLVGYNTGTINLAYATGAVNSSSYSGGLVGYNKGTISQAYATGTVSGAAGSGNSPLGGLVGANVLGAISQAYATGAVNGGTANRVGGLVGWNDRGMIDQAYATGAVNGGNYVGGLVGFGSGSISRTYATGAVSGVDYVGGLVGLGQTGSISQAYATGAVSGRNYLGGLVGSGGSSIIGSYWDMETTGQTYGCSCYGDVTGLTTAQMMDPARFTYWGIATAGGSTSAWRTYAGHTAPLLRAFMTPLALGSDNVSLVYNGSDQTSSNYTYGTLTPGFWLPSASVDASLILGSAGASLGARNVGNHALDLSPYSGQMGYDIDYTAGTLTITPATLTLSAVGDSKAYNGTTDSAGMVTFGGLLAGDSLAGLTQSFASKNVLGTNASTLGVDAGYVLDDGNGGGNYIIATHTAAGTIAPYVVDLGGSRVYDGSAAVDAGDLVLGTLVGNETLTLSGTGSMADKNVGNGKSFTLGTLTLSDGTGDAANYILAGGNDTVDISKRAIVVDATGADKVYDGTTADAVKLASTSLLVGDTVNFSGTGAFADKNVGVAKAVGVSGIAATGADANNYSYNTTANTAADITALGVTVDATGINRVYDGTTADAVALASAGVLSSDTVNFIGTGSFADKNVGTGKTVSVSGIAAGGSDANNYSYNTTAATTADITAKTITINATGVDKVYDGSTAATIAALGATGLVAGDVVTFDNASAAFDDKNAGTGKTVTVHGIAAAGTDAGNYSFNPTANTTADISQLGITVGATGTNKVYDGTTADAVALASDGVLSGDSVAFTGTGRFADKNVGSAKAVGVSGIAASGRDAGNYRYNTAATTTADVTPATLTYRADAALFQTGQMPGGLSGAVTGLVGGESLGEATDGTLTWTTPADSASPAGLYAIDGGGLSALNYLFEQAPENATALQVAPGSASRVVTTVVAGLQQDEASPDDDTSAPYAPSVHIVDGGVRLP